MKTLVHRTVRGMDRERGMGSYVEKYSKYLIKSNDLCRQMTSKDLQYTNNFNLGLSWNIKYVATDRNDLSLTFRTENREKQPAWHV